MAKIIEVKGLSKFYGDKKALDKVSFSLPEKGFVFVNGVSGSGKTTLINIMMGLDSPTEGEVQYKGRTISDFSSAESDEYRNTKLGIVFQNFNLVDDITVRENLMLPLKIQDLSEEQRVAMVDDAIEYVGLKEYSNHKGYELSTGQKQRIAIARAIVKKPEIIFADEATGNLDAQNTEQILRIFNDISKSCLVVLISHNEHSAKKFGDRIITLSEGSVVKDIDNRNLKEFYHAPYNIRIEADGYEHEMALSAFDFKEELKELAEKKTESKTENKIENKTENRPDDKPKKENVRLDNCTLKTTITYDSSLERKPVYSGVADSAKSKTLSFRDIVEMSAKVFCRKKGKNISSLIIIVFIAVLLLLSLTVFTNDFSRAEIKYISEDTDLIYKVKKQVYRENTVSSHYYGKQVADELDQIGPEKLINTVVESTITVNDNDEGFTVFAKSDVLGDAPIEGRWPAKDSEIAISRATAEDAGLSIGKKIELFPKMFKVVGIVDVAEYYGGYCGIVCQNFEKDYFLRCPSVTFEACDITASTNLDNYVESVCAIGNLDNLKKKMLVWGRMPRGKNEVIVSESFAKEKGFDLDYGFAQEYRLPDIHAEQYGLEYDSKMNLYDYFGNKVMISGIYKSGRELGDTLVAADIYRNMITDWLKYYMPHKSFVCFAGDDQTAYNTDLLRSLEDRSFQIDQDVCDFMVRAKLTIKYIWYVFVLLLLVICCVMLAVLNSTLSNNVRESYKLIGVYKSLGISDADVTKIYLLVNMCILFTGIVISSVLCKVLVNAVNWILNDMFLQRKVDVFLMNWPMIVGAVTIFIFIAAFASIRPMRKLLSKDIVKLINREEY